MGVQFCDRRLKRSIPSFTGVSAAAAAASGAAAVSAIIVRLVMWLITESLHGIQVRDQVRHFLCAAETGPSNTRFLHAAEHLRPMPPQRRNDRHFRVFVRLSWQLRRAVLASQVALGAAAALRTPSCRRRCCPPDIQTGASRDS